MVLGLGGVAAYFAASLSQNAQHSTSDGETLTQSQQTKTPSSDDNRKTSVTYDGQTGKTAIELLKSHAAVETKAYTGIGEMVVSIDGTKPKDSSEFWAFYVDGKQAQVGADQYVTKDGEKIEWKLEKIQ